MVIPLPTHLHTYKQRNPLPPLVFFVGDGIYLQTYAYLHNASVGSVGLCRYAGKIHRSSMFAACLAFCRCVGSVGRYRRERGAFNQWEDGRN